MDLFCSHEDAENEIKIRNYLKIESYDDWRMPTLEDEEMQQYPKYMDPIFKGDDSDM